jgi:uncharacterized membrane protein YdjX (TVP38/TMEM64 family)
LLSTRTHEDGENFCFLRWDLQYWSQSVITTHTDNVQNKLVSYWIIERNNLLAAAQEFKEFKANENTIVSSATIMGKSVKPPQSGGLSLDSSPPLLPLEDNNNMMMMRSRSNTETSLDAANDDEPPIDLKKKKQKTRKAARMQSKIPKWTIKKLVLAVFGMCFVTIVYESFFLEPQDRLLQPDFADTFLMWVQSHPGWGLGAISLVIAGAVVSMVPIGTPLTLGCGYIYRGVYGWKLGLFVATAVSMLGSCLGACTCFLLGRYLMRDTVRRWVRKYPLFDAIDVGKFFFDLFGSVSCCVVSCYVMLCHVVLCYVMLCCLMLCHRMCASIMSFVSYLLLAASEQGVKIMAMLYLTPVLPLGLVSYMCGTTSMHLSAFAMAKIFSLPLYLITTFIGASAHSFIKKRGGEKDDEKDIGISVADQAKEFEENQVLIVSGIVLSMVMMALLTRYIRKELMKVRSVFLRALSSVNGGSHQRINQSINR